MVASEAKRSNEQWEFDMMFRLGKEQEVEEEEEEELEFGRLKRGERED